jgi:hypothetical protein
VVFDGEKSLRTNEARLIELATLAIALIQGNGESVGMSAAGDLAENQIGAWKIRDHQSRPAFPAVFARKWNDNDFAGYRFDHAVSSEFQSRPRTDSLSSAPLKVLFSSESSGAISLWSDSRVFINQSFHLPRSTPSTQRILFSWRL